MVRSASLVCILLVVTLPLSRADTVYLKTGGLIKDCRTVKEEGGTVFLRTPGGPMGVPREDILRIEKDESVFDAYDKQRAKVRKDDAAGHFELARWCRQEAGLRQEANELLKKVVAIQPNHSMARKLLGYYKDGAAWRQVPPLSIALKLTASRDSEDAKAEDVKKPDRKSATRLDATTTRELKEVLSQQLSILLSTRSDVQLVPSVPSAKSAHGCELLVEVRTGKTGAAIFYGQQIRGPATHTAISIAPVAQWAQKKVPPLELAGEVPGSLPEASQLPVIDALTRGFQDVHQFFDTLNDLRLTSAALNAARKDGAEKKQGANKKAAPKKK